MPKPLVTIQMKKKCYFQSPLMKFGVKVFPVNQVCCLIHYIKKIIYAVIFLFKDNSYLKWFVSHTHFHFSPYVTNKGPQVKLKLANLLWRNVPVSMGLLGSPRLACEPRFRGGNFASIVFPTAVHTLVCKDKYPWVKQVYPTRFFFPCPLDGRNHDAQVFFCLKWDLLP